MKARPGHLASGPLNLKQTEKVKANLSSAQKYNEVMKRAEPVNLGWQVKSKGE